MLVRWLQMFAGLGEGVDEQTARACLVIAWQPPRRLPVLAQRVMAGGAGWPQSAGEPLAVPGVALGVAVVEPTTPVFTLTV